MINKIKNLPYPVLGGAAGLSLAASILFIGFFRTLFILILVGIGTTVGTYFQNSRK
ncbi:MULTISPECIES: DUF2273 domain-containing protein [Abiotrophia]|uniref:DUF2273 domain-containing protein n=1 Tax=Bacteria TaxID=2 RepID=UPI0027B95D7B|nr:MULTISPECIES: DUF2273 domain-containing protein [Abiotrophia]